MRPTNGPVHSRTKLKYPAPVSSAEIIVTAPARATSIGPMICQQWLRVLPEDHEIIRAAMYAITYGGAWTRYVTTSVKLRVSTI